MSRYFDVVIVTDPRLQGGGNKSIAEEVRAHGVRGYSTAIYPVYADLNISRPIDRSIQELLDEKLASLAAPGEELETRLLLARGPGLFQRPPHVLPRIRAEHRVFVINAFATHGALSGMAYDPVRLVETVSNAFGGDWIWTALSPVVRAALMAAVPDFPLVSWDWPNVIDVDRWRVPRSFDRPRLVIGRHSRDHGSKWPTDPAIIAAAYPDTGSFDVHVMGGVKTLRSVLPRMPQWRVYDFDEVPVPQFLAGIDIFTYLHHPRLIEAFGRNVLEAMASGAPCVVPRYLSATFGDGLLYVDDSVSSVRAVYARLREDRRLLQAHSHEGVQIARDRFSASVHQQRLLHLIGPPRKPSVAVPPSRTPAPRRPSPPTVLFYTDNGHGLGHITRLLAVAREAGRRFVPVFLTLSEGYPVLRRFGIPAEYFPSYRRLALKRERWHELLAVRLLGMIRRLQVRVVVIDHVGPPPVLAQVRAAVTGVDFIWSRRGLWRSQRNEHSLAASALFDSIVEPTDIAAPIDAGLTPIHRTKVQSVPPVVLVRPDDMLDRRSARQALDVPPDAKAYLIQLTHSDPERLAALISRTRDVLGAYVGPGALYIAPRHVLHFTRLPRIPGVRLVEAFPMALYLRAFDGVISTAGYNSFHEVVGSSIPAVFIPRDSNSLDDQSRRAEFAALCGRAFWAPSLDGPDFERAVAAMIRPNEARIAAAVAAQLGPFDGAARFADLLAQHAHLRHHEPSCVRPLSLPARTDVLAHLVSGTSLPPKSIARTRRIVVVALEHTDDQLRQLVEQVATIQGTHFSFRPVFLTDGTAPWYLSERRFVYETLMNPDEWHRTGAASSYGDYVRDRVREVRALYQCDSVVVANPDVPLQPWMFP